MSRLPWNFGRRSLLLHPLALPTYGPGRRDIRLEVDRTGGVEGRVVPRRREPGGLIHSELLDRSNCFDATAAVSVPNHRQEELLLA